MNKTENTTKSIDQKWESYVNGGNSFATEDDVNIADEFLDQEINKFKTIGILLDRIKIVCGGNCNTEDAARTLATMLVNAEMTEQEFLASEITDDEILDNCMIPR